MNTMTKLPAPALRSDADWIAAVDQPAVLYTSVHGGEVVGVTKWHGVAFGLDEPPVFMFEVTVLADLDTNLRYVEQFPGTEQGYADAIRFHRGAVSLLVQDVDSPSAESWGEIIEKYRASVAGPEEGTGG